MKKMVLILHNIRSAYNVGALFRTADCFGVDRIYLGGYTPDPARHKAVAKTALGAESFVSWERFWHTHKLLEKLRAEGYFVLGLEISESSKRLDCFKSNEKIALVLGNEVSGLSERMMNRMDGVAEIAMFGKKESLNVSVAGSIAMYELSKKGNEKEKGKVGNI